MSPTFVRWIAVVFVITHVHFGAEAWLKGLIVAIVMALPVIILVLKPMRNQCRLFW